MPESARGGLSGRKPRDAALLLEAMIALRTKRATGPRAIAHPVIAIAIAAIAGAMPVGCRFRDRVPPNVLLISVDTLRADYVGSSGFTFDTSPGIDALAAKGASSKRRSRPRARPRPPTRPS
jgi:hypothetical protein